MRAKTISGLLGFAFLPGWGPCALTAAQAVDVYGDWHCGNDCCTWSTVRDLNEDDSGKPARRYSERHEARP